VSTDKPIPLRQRNAVNLRLAVVDMVKDRLRETTLDNIVIKPMCKELGIATATFFNHFPQKTDILIYFIELWTARLEFEALEKTGGVKGTLLIEAMFSLLADDIAEHPRLMLEIIAFIARADSRPSGPQVSAVDLQLAWPNLIGIADRASKELGEVLRENIEVAFEREVKPVAKTNAAMKKLDSENKRRLFESLVSLFYGYPLAAKVIGIENISGGIHSQIQLLWRAFDVE